MVSSVINGNIGAAHPRSVHISSCPDCQENLETINQSDDTLISKLLHPPNEDMFLVDPERQKHNTHHLAGNRGWIYLFALLAIPTGTREDTHSVNPIIGVSL